MTDWHSNFFPIETQYSPTNLDYKIILEDLGEKLIEFNSNNNWQDYKYNERDLTLKNTFLPKYYEAPKVPT